MITTHQEPTAAELVGPVSEITDKQIDRISRALMPKAAEFSAMVQQICDRKGWNRRFLASLLSFSAKELSAYESGRKRIPSPIVKLVWLFNTLDASPELVFSIPHIVTWGKTELPVITKRRRNTLNATQKELLEKFFDENARSRMTCSQIKQKIEPIVGSISISSIRRYCAMFGYKPANGWRRGWRAKRATTMFSPDSPWMNVNWGQGNEKIAKATGTSPHYVKNVRSKLRNLPPRVMLRHIVACGKDRNNFRAIFKSAKTGRPTLRALSMRAKRVD